MLRALERRLRFDQRNLVSDSGVVLRLCVIDGFAVGSNGVVEQFLKRVLSANLEQQLRESRLLRQLLVREIGCTDLRRESLLCDRVAHFAPQVGFPRNGSWQLE